MLPLSALQVVQLFEASFGVIMSSIETLRFVHLGWNDESVTSLACALDVGITFATLLIL
jgi:hypothetical protein